MDTKEKVQIVALGESIGGAKEETVPPKNPDYLDNVLILVEHTFKVFWSMLNMKIKPGRAQFALDPGGGRGHLFLLGASDTSLEGDRIGYHFPKVTAGRLAKKLSGKHRIITEKSSEVLLLKLIEKILESLNQEVPAWKITLASHHPDSWLSKGREANRQSQILTIPFGSPMGPFFLTKDMGTHNQINPPTSPRNNKAQAQGPGGG